MKIFIDNNETEVKDEKAGAFYHTVCFHELGLISTDGRSGKNFTHFDREVCDQFRAEMKGKQDKCKTEMEKAIVPVKLFKDLPSEVFEKKGNIIALRNIISNELSEKHFTVVCSYGPNKTAKVQKNYNKFLEKANKVIRNKIKAEEAKKLSLPEQVISNLESIEK